MTFSKVLAAFLLLPLLSTKGCPPPDFRGVIYQFADYEKYKDGKVIGGKELPPFELPERNPSQEYLQFFAVGCAGTGNPGQHLVAEEMAKVAATEKPSFVLYLGDNFYPVGVKSTDDDQWQKKFQKVYDQESLQIPFYAVLGNHDYYENELAQVEYTQRGTRWIMPDRYYVFQRKLNNGTVIDFFALDTNAMLWMEDLDQAKWLEEQLEKSKADWKVVFGHHPLYSGDRERRKDAPLMRKILLPILTQHHVDLYVSAHSHTLEAMNPVEGVNFVVSGAGSRPRDKVYWTEDTLYAGANKGFAWIQISKEEINVIYLGEGGKVYYSSRIPAATTLLS